MTSESTLYGGELIFSGKAEVFARRKTTATTAVPTISNLQSGNRARSGLLRFAAMPIRTPSRKDGGIGGVFHSFSSSSSSVSFIVLAPHSAHMRSVSAGDRLARAANAT